MKGKEIIDLYRKLLKYGKTLQLTDHDYYLTRIKTEFRAEVKSPEQLEFRYKVSSVVKELVGILFYF